jgi:hypothetical protein
MTANQWHPQDVGFVCAWIAFVGLCVEQSWTIALIVLGIVGFVVGVLNS